MIYRTGPAPGASLADANLAADSVTVLAEPGSQPPNQPLALASAVTNPLAIENGVAPEAPETTRILAPEAWRARPLRAVRDEDYREIAEEQLDWVQRGGAQALWTGSWLTEFVTADPEGAFALSEARREELFNLVDAIRQAGREGFVVDPDFISIDLDISVCVQPGHYPGDVEARVIDTLTRQAPAASSARVFRPRQFHLRRPAAPLGTGGGVQSKPGVHGVENIRIRARRITDWRRIRRARFPCRRDADHSPAERPRFPERGPLSCTRGAGA